MGFLELILGSIAAFIFMRASRWWSGGDKKTEAPLQIDSNGKWFGSGEPKTEDESVKPYKIHVEDSALEELKTRLENSRIGHDVLEDVDDFYYGFNLRYLKTVVAYWKDQFDWRKQEAVLNSFDNFTTQIDGLRIHFIHSKAAKGYKEVYPVLVVHGWPGNVFEFYKFIPILNDPKAHGIDSDIAFDVVAPSIPGYGWSDSPKKSGFSAIAAGIIFHKLLLRLNYDRYFVQGGDWGSAITRSIAYIFPRNVLGVHNNMMPTLEHSSAYHFARGVLGSYFPKRFFSNPFFHNYSLKTKIFDLLKETGYMHIQASKPDTVGVALNDSPVGLAAYILEKYSTWTNPAFKALPDGGLTKKFILDELLTIITIYWVNGNILSSQRFYREQFLEARNGVLSKRYLSVPLGHAHTEHDIFDQTPREFYDKLFNIVHEGEIRDCGHFAAFEEPQKLAADFVKFTNKICI